MGNIYRSSTPDSSGGIQAQGVTRAAFVPRAVPVGWGVAHGNRQGLEEQGGLRKDGDPGLEAFPLWPGTLQA